MTSCKFKRQFLINLQVCFCRSNMEEGTNWARACHCFNYSVITVTLLLFFHVHSPHLEHMQKSWYAHKNGNDYGCQVRANMFHHSLMQAFNYKFYNWVIFLILGRLTQLKILHKAIVANHMTNNLYGLWNFWSVPWMNKMSNIWNNFQTCSSIEHVSPIKIPQNCRG